MEEQRDDAVHLKHENQQLREELRSQRHSNERGGYQRLVSGLTRRWAQQHSEERQRNDLSMSSKLIQE